MANCRQTRINFLLDMMSVYTIKYENSQFFDELFNESFYQQELSFHTFLTIILKFICGVAVFFR
jgi:hypothetical protein